jgi:hypothetical protein
LSCHDGTLTRRMAAHLSASRPGEPERDALSGHPIGVDFYAALQRHPADFNDPRAMGASLENGSVGCTSCHIGHAAPGRRPGPSASLRDSCPACHNQ